MTRRAVGPLSVDRQLTSTGDAAVWVAPLTGTTAKGWAAVAIILTFTADQRHYAVRVDRNELHRLADTIDNLLAADDHDIEKWLDAASAAVLASANRAPTASSGVR